VIVKTWLYIIIIIYLTIQILFGVISIKIVKPAHKVRRKEPKFYPLVSVVIPAKNEENNIQNCLDSLMVLNYPDFEVIVVEGNSTDKTQEILKEYQVKMKQLIVIQEETKPKGWVGKPWACHSGYQHTKGDVLLFTDADTIHSPNSLRYMIGELEDSLGFITLLTTQILKSFWEKILLLVFIIGTVSLGGYSNNKRHSFANGQYMMFKREVYEEIGGFQSVKNAIVDDYAMGKMGRDLGYDPKVLRLYGCVFARMYQSLREIKQGYSKNLAIGVSLLNKSEIAKANAIGTWAIAPIIILLLSLISSDNVLETIGFVLALIFYLSFLYLLHIVQKSATTGVSWHILLFPIHYMLYQIIVLNSIIDTKIKKKVVWKSESYKVN